MQNMSSSSFFQPNFIFQMQNPNEQETLNLHHQSSILNPLFPSSNPQDFSIGIAAVGRKRSMSFSGNFEGFEAEEEISDDCSQLGEKKRRLNTEQVRTLEKNFELGNKLEPDRKTHLAKTLGLQPRQIAIWFQNRRARWKTKQLEKDYDLLKMQFEAIKTENVVLQTQNKKLQAEILSLRGREAAEVINLNKETEGSCSNRTENSSDNSLLNQNEKIEFLSSIRQPMISQFLNGSSTPDLNCIKIENGFTDEQHFSNLLCGMETAIWPWSDHHNHQ